MNINVLFLEKGHSQRGGLVTLRILVYTPNEMAQHQTTDEMIMLSLFLCIAIEGALALQVQSQAGWRKIRHVKRMCACV